jgi:hypothetical protein
MPKIFYITTCQGDINQSHKKLVNITSHQSQWLLSKRLMITSAGKDMDKKEHFHTVGGNVN